MIYLCVIADGPNCSSNLGHSDDASRVYYWIVYILSGNLSKNSV